jgi:tetratricopeptide (TPR) repeat protein
MKYRLVAGTLLAMIMLTGCGSLAGRHNIDSGFTYIESHEYLNALESFEAAAAAGEDSELIFRGRGIAHLYSGEYQQAVEELLASLAADNGLVDDMDLDTNFYLAEAYTKLGDYAAATEVYDAIINIKSKDSTAYYLRGVAELAAGNHDAGYADFSKAISLNSRDYSTIILIYKTLAQYGYSEEGTAILQTAMDNGGNYMTNFEKGQISYYLGNNDDAVKYLNTARNERDQEKEPVVILLGQVWERLGEYNDAYSNYYSYLKDNPDSAAVYNQLGMCQIRQQDYDGAISSFESGLKLEDNSVKQALLLNRITAYEFKGDFEYAKTLMSEYLNSYPGDADAARENVFLSTR